MKDAIGGTWLMGLVLIFVVLFSSFLAFAVNYTKAFRVKNEVINIIERHEGYSSSGTTVIGATDDDSAEGEIVNYLKKIGYNTNPDLNVTCPTQVYGNEINTSNSTNDSQIASIGLKKHNLCIKRFDYDKSGVGAVAYYKVTSFVIVEIPMVFNSIAIPVSGETKRIYNDTSAVS